MLYKIPKINNANDTNFNMFKMLARNKMIISNKVVIPNEKSHSIFKRSFTNRMIPIYENQNKINLNKYII